MKSLMLIQAVFQTADPDAWAAVSLAEDEQPVCSVFMNPTEIHTTRGSWVSPSHMGAIESNELPSTVSGTDRIADQRPPLAVRDSAYRPAFDRWMRSQWARSWTTHVQPVAHFTSEMLL